MQLAIRGHRERAGLQDILAEERAVQDAAQTKGLHLHPQSLTPQDHQGARAGPTNIGGAFHTVLRPTSALGQRARPTAAQPEPQWRAEQRRHEQQAVRQHEQQQLQQRQQVPGVLPGPEADLVPKQQQVAQPRVPLQQQLAPVVHMQQQSRPSASAGRQRKRMAAA